MTNRRPWFVFGLVVAIACDFAGCGEQDGTPATHVGPTSNGGTGQSTTGTGVAPGNGATTGGGGATTGGGGATTGGGGATTGGGGATTGQGGTGGAAGTPGSGTVQNGVSAAWTFPALVTDADGSTFPTYLAHLLGRKVAHPFPTDFACVTVSNSGKDPATIHLEVDFAVYATPKSQDVTIAARSSRQTCLTPTFDIDALYHLTAPVTGMIEGHATDQADGNVGSVNQVVSVPPVGDVPWVDQGIATRDMKSLAAVYVEPHAPVIDQLQRLAQPNSVFANFGDGDPYHREPYARKATIDASEYMPEPIYVESGENVAWALSAVSCATCASPSVDVYIMTVDQFTGWTNGTSNAATAVWTNQVTGAQRTQSLAQGWYYFVVYNTDGAAGRDVTWARSVTREDVVRDLLTSLFSALRGLGVTYSSVTNTYFDDGWQHVRRVSESIQALSANCVDGALVFASAAELLGVEPVVIFRSGHAYVGIRSAPGSPVIWPIETTMVGDPSSKPWDAYLYAMTARQKEMTMDPVYQEVDVAAMRQAGITPLVQQ
jgi:hypothetical protein